MIVKRGAMFGLDARIALAIFGALSVISGAALYSAIQDAKVTALHTFVKEVEKSAEQLLLDLGYFPQYSTGKPNAAYLSSNIGDLSDWNGPYMSLNLESGDSTYIIGSNFKGSIIRASGITTCSGYGSSPIIIKPSNEKYYLMLRKYGSMSGPDCNIDWSTLVAFHDKYDNDADYDSGNIIIKKDAVDTNKGGLIYKLPTRLFNFS